MVLFCMSSGAEQVPTVFVGESISCDCGGVEGRWSVNGVDINVTASQIQDTISVVNGSFNYDGTLDCDSGGDPCEYRALGESRCVYSIPLMDCSLYRGGLVAEVLNV